MFVLGIVFGGFFGKVGKECEGYEVVSMLRWSMYVLWWGGGIMGEKEGVSRRFLIV